MTYRRRTIGSRRRQDLHDEAEGSRRALLDLRRSASPSSNVPFMMPKRVAETDPQHADLRLHRLRPLRLQAGRVEAGRQGRLRQEFDKYKPRTRARVGPRGRQGRQGRPRRVARDRGSQQRGERAARGRDRHHRGAAARPAAAAQARRQERRARSTGTRLGRQYTFRLNCIAEAVRQSEGPAGRRCMRFNQKDFLDATIGDPEYYKVCKALFVVRHAARDRQGHGGTCSSRTATKAQGAAEGSQLRRHADRAACSRPTCRCSPTSRRSRSRCWRRPASRSTCSRWTGRRWSRAAPRRTRPHCGGWHVHARPHGSRPTSSIPS